MHTCPSSFYSHTPTKHTHTTNPPIQIALKTEQAGVLFLKDVIGLEALLEEGGAIDGASFLAAWKALPPESHQRLAGLVVHDVEAAKAKLQAANLFVLAHRPVSCVDADY